MIRAILFDLDGTLADTIPAITEGINATLAHFSLEPYTPSDVRAFINHGPRHLIASALASRGVSDEASVDRALALYREEYRAIALQTREAYPGVPDLVSSLHKSFKIGILSNKQDELVAKIAQQVLHSGSFDASVGTFPDKPPKPDPFLPNLLCSRLGVTPSECILVGDSDVDIRTAANAGMLHVGVSWGYLDASALREKGARLVANSAPELASLLKSYV